MKQPASCTFLDWCEASFSFALLIFRTYILNILFHCESVPRLNFSKYWSGCYRTNECFGSAIFFYECLSGPGVGYQHGYPHCMGGDSNEFCWCIAEPRPFPCCWFCLEEILEVSGICLILQGVSNITASILNNKRWDYFQQNMCLFPLSNTIDLNELHNYFYTWYF